ncbi:MAG: flagellar hook-associated protein FlgK [Betaproteobacteria bacterium]
MSGSLLGIALTGLNSAQGGLVTTGHNIANVHTPGYSRQKAVQTQNPPQATGAGFFGTGSNIQTVLRAYDEFLAAQGLSMQAGASHWSTALAQLQDVDQLLADGDVGVLPALNGLFAAANGLGANPGDAASRGGMLSAIHAVAARLRDLDGSLQRLGAANDQRITGAVATINAISAQIASLNERITLAGGGTGQPPNDLLDHRDALVADLNRMARASVVEKSDGGMDVFLGNGQALVVGGRAYVLDVRADPLDPAHLSIGLRSGATQVGFRPRDLEGGELGGLLAFREGTLDPARNALGRIAIVLAAEFNGQHRLGVDRSGQPGGDVFVAGASQCNASANNAGSAQMAASLIDVAALTDSDYRVQWDGVAWQVTRLADGAVQGFATLPQTVDGIAISVTSGAPATGDAFLVLPTRNGAAGFAALLRSADQIAAAAPIRTSAAAGNAGTGAISSETVVGPTVDPNLQQAVTISFTGPGTYSVTGTGTGNPTGLPYTPGAAISFNGWTIEIDGAPAAGDSFTVAANAGGSGDSRNASLLADLQALALVGGRSTLAGAFGELLARVGTATQEAGLSAAAQTRLLEESQARQASVSGVNLDEEAANLLRYQQAYQAAGKLVAVAGQLFETLLQMGR